MGLTMVRLRCVFAATASLALSVFLCGCALGPSALRASRLPYNEVIQQTANEQLLLNLARLRYREGPVFLEVGSVAAQFAFEDLANISGTINENIPGEPINPDVLQLGGVVRYQEQPTITFSPLQGDDFVRRLLSPLQLETVVLLSRSGWSLDRVLRLTVQQMNGLNNARRGSGPTPDQAPQYEQFARVSSLLRKLQVMGMLQIGYESRPLPLSEPVPAEAVTATDIIDAAREGYRFEAVDDARVVLTGTSEVLVWRIAPAIADLPEVRQIIELLDLEPGRDAYELRLAAASASDPREASGGRTRIDVTTRSLMGTLFYLSHAIEVPDKHRERGLVTTTVDPQGRVFDWARVTGDLLRVHSRAMPPRSAAVAVRYAGQWFFIDNSDLTSKSTFALLGQLFALQAGAEVGPAPVLTLPIGG